MNMDRDQEAMKARLAELKVDPPHQDAFEESLRNALAQDGLETSTSTGSWQTWIKAHPLFSGAAMGLLTALLVLYVGIPQQGSTPTAPTHAVPSVGPTAAKPVIEKAEGPAMEATHRVPTKGVALIKFHFSSEVAVADVDMQVELPAGLRFWSKGQELEQNAVAWRSGLKAGENTFPVAIFAGKTGTYQVIATAEVDGQVIQHEVVIEVVEEA